MLLLNPIEIGCNRFFTKNLNEDAQVKEICYSFDYGYKQNIKTMFFRDLYVFLWSLLFVIPGIIKSYEYSMIPFILGENHEKYALRGFLIKRFLILLALTGIAQFFLNILYHNWIYPWLSNVFP